MKAIKLIVTLLIICQMSNLMGQNTVLDSLGEPVLPGQMIADYSGKTMQEISGIRDYLSDELGGESLDSCHCGYLELWLFPDVGTDLQSRGVTEETDLDDDDIAYNYSLGVSTLNDVGLSAVDLGERGDLTINDRTLVAVIDSGIDGELEEFDGKLWSSDLTDSNANCDSNIDFGFNVVHPNISIEDGVGHGTHVSGIIINENPSVELMVIKVVKEGSGNLFDVICGIHFAIENNAEVINLSMTQQGERNAVFEKAVLKARDANVIIVCSAGNGGLDLETSPMKYWPGGFDYGNIVNVAAIDPYGDLCSFSNYGLTDVDLGAPGLYIESLVPSNSNADVKSGTSMATAFVTREITVLKYENPNLTNEEIIGMLYSDSLEDAPALLGNTSQGKKLGRLVYKNE